MKSFLLTLVTVPAAMVVALPHHGPYFPMPNGTSPFPPAPTASAAPWIVGILPPYKPPTFIKAGHQKRGEDETAPNGLAPRTDDKVTVNPKDIPTLPKGAERILPIPVTNCTLPANSTLPGGGWFNGTCPGQGVHIEMHLGRAPLPPKKRTIWYGTLPWQKGK